MRRHSRKLKHKVLLLGCGNCKIRKLIPNGKDMNFKDSEVTRIDIDPDCNPDILMSLDGLGKRSFLFKKRLPFPDNYFDEIAAYDSLEHFGKQGDWKGFFLEFGEYHRVLKKGGEFCCLVPINEDAYADPGHVRFFGSNHFGFLNQEFYKVNLENGTSITDYRHFWKKNFDIRELVKKDNHIAAVLIKT